MVFLLTLLCFATVGLQAQQTQTVTAEGRGVDLQSAVKDAAENALVQIVGTLVDAPTLSQNTSRIKADLKHYAAHISPDISRYSQGIIRDFQILDKRHDPAQWSVAARVAVSLEELRSYAKTFASGATAIDSRALTGLVDQNTSDAKQLADAVAAIAKSLRAIASGGMHRFEVGAPVPFSTAPLCERQRDCEEDRRTVIDTLKRGGFDLDRLVYFPVAVRLSAEGLSELRNIVDQSKQLAKRYSCTSYEAKQHKGSCYVADTFEGRSDRSSTWIAFDEVADGSFNGTAYRLAVDARELGAALGCRPMDHEQELFCLSSPKGLRLQIKSSTGELLRTGKRAIVNRTEMNTDKPWILLSRPGDNYVAVRSTKILFGLLAELPVETVRQAATVVVTLDD